MDKIALTNVRVFDGERLLEPATVVIDGDRIGEDQTGAQTWEGDGGVLTNAGMDARLTRRHVRLEQDAARRLLAGLPASGVSCRCRRAGVQAA